MSLLRTWTIFIFCTSLLLSFATSSPLPLSVHQYTPAKDPIPPLNFPGSPSNPITLPKPAGINYPGSRNNPINIGSTAITWKPTPFFCYFQLLRLTITSIFGNEKGWLLLEILLKESKNWPLLKKKHHSIRKITREKICRSRDTMVCSEMTRRLSFSHI